MLIPMIKNLSYRYLTATPGVRGGSVRVDGTRIGVHDVIAYFLLGSNFEEVLKRFPDLSRSQVYECLSYYEDHKAEVEGLAMEQLDSSLLVA